MTADQLIKEGHQAIKRGDKDEARRLLREAAQQNPADHRAWLGLAAVARTPRESLAFIEKAAELQPDNPAVQQARQWANGLVARQNEQAPPLEATQPTAATLPVWERPIQDRLKTQTTPVAATMDFELEPVESSDSILSSLTMRRVISGAALLGIVIAMGIVAWFAYTTWRNSELGNNSIASPESTPTSVAVALVPSAQVSNILPEQEAVVAAVQETATPTPNPIQPKYIIQGASEPRPRWTITPLPTETPTPSPTWAPTFVSPLSEAGLLKPVGLLPNERWVDVDLSDQSLVAYEGETPVFETLVSTGLPNHPTVIGQFRIWLRFESQTMDGSRLGYDYYLENVQFVQYFFEDYALHGTYWHSNFGRPMSHGCVNLSNADAEFLYTFADYGTVVNVHE